MGYLVVCTSATNALCALQNFIPLHNRMKKKKNWARQFDINNLVKYK